MKSLSSEIVTGNIDVIVRYAVSMVNGDECWLLFVVGLLKLSAVLFHQIECNYHDLVFLGK